MIFARICPSYTLPRMHTFKRHTSLTLQDENCVHFVSLHGQIGCGAFSQRGDQKRCPGHDKKQVVFAGIPWLGGGLATKHGGLKCFNWWILKHEHMEELIGDG